MKNFVHNWRTTLGALLAVVGLMLYWFDVIDRQQYEAGMGIVVIYIAVVAKDGNNKIK